MKYDPTAQYLPAPKFQRDPEPYRTPKEVIHDFIRHYRLTDPDGLPSIKSLMKMSKLSQGTVSTYRANFFSADEKTVPDTESDELNPC